MGTDATGASSAATPSAIATPRLPRLGWRGLALPAALVLAAEVAMRARTTPSDSLAAPSAVILALGRAMRDGSLWLATLQTLSGAFGGLLLGGGLGLLLGVWFGLSRRAATRSALSLELLKPIPSVALIPVAMMVFGFGYRLEIAVVAFTTLFPMLILTQAAVRAVSPRLLEVSAVLGLSSAQRLTKIVLPAVLPRVFVAFRLSVGIALVVAITTEVATNPQGLGYGLISAQQSLAPDLMLAQLVWVGVLGWCMAFALGVLQRRWFGRFGVEVAA